MVELDWRPELRQVHISRQKPLPCSPVPVFLMVKVDWRSELRQVDTSRWRTLRFSPVPVFLMVKPEWRVETLEVPDDLTSDVELQQPAPRRSRYGRLLKLRKGLVGSC
ncbi:hypothetical protein TNCT_371401 [Trichonephila clavata]|uniref:Uncharacterized protein n=1 Tax=Trichonephila clavata TaxID=2740835 RepID=A0A8X6LUU2_TRICU|nr:hypothetical protein TNCT_371401 [Trichonephila clavata]